MKDAPIAVLLQKYTISLKLGADCNSGTMPIPAPRRSCIQLLHENLTSTVGSSVTYLIERVGDLSAEVNKAK